MALKPGNEKEKPNGESARPAPKRFSDDVGGVGAHGDHLAMRHVDDAHQPERDREAERHDKQDAAERGAAEERTQEVDGGAVRFDRPNGGARGVDERWLLRGLGVLERHLHEIGAGEGAERLQLGQGGELRRIGGGLQADEGDGFAECGAGEGLGLGDEAGLENRELLGVLRKTDDLDRAQAFLQIGRAEIEEIEDGLHRAAER